MNSISAMAIVKIVEGINIFLSILTTLIFAYVILSWIMRPTNGLFRIVSRIAQPILAPFRPIARKLIQRGLMVDITPFLAMLAIQIIRNIIIWIVYQL